MRKTLKKTMAIVLTIFMAASLFVMPAWADEAAPTPDPKPVDTVIKCFEEYPLDDWTFEGNGDFNYWDNRVNLWGSSDIALISPEMTGIGGGQMRFTTYAYDRTKNGAVDVYVSTDGGENWSENPIEHCLLTTYGEEQRYVDLRAYAGQDIMLKFVLVCNGEYQDVLIKNVEVFPPQYEPDFSAYIKGSEVAPGEEITVEFRLTGEYNATNLSACLNFDPNQLTFVEGSVVHGEVWDAILAANVYGWATIDVQLVSPGKLQVATTGPLASFHEQGVIFTAKFKVAENVPSETLIKITPEVIDFNYVPVGWLYAMPIAYTTGLNGQGTVQVLIWHTVVFKDYDGTELKTEQVLDHHDATAPEAPNDKYGYHFTGWEPDYTDVTEDLTVIAQYEANPHTITYVINGDYYIDHVYNPYAEPENYKVQESKFDAEIVPPAFTVPAEHEWTGWYYDKELKDPVKPGDKIDEDKDYTIYSECQVNYYDLFYNLTVTTETVEGHEGTQHLLYGTQHLPYGEPFDRLKLDVADGWTFIDWDFSDFETYEDRPVMPNHDVTLEATLATNHYVIFFTINGEPYTSVVYEFGEKVVMPEYDKPEGYDFTWWEIPDTMPAENLVLDAQLTPHVYTITYYIDNELDGEANYNLYTTMYYEYLTKLNLPGYEPLPEYCDITPWHFLNGDPAPETMPHENLKLYAELSYKVYTIDYDLDGGWLPDGEENPATYSYDTEDITLVNPIRTGWKFIGWTDDDVEDAPLMMNVTIPQGSFGNRAFTAHWEHIKYSAFYYVNGEPYMVDEEPVVQEYYFGDPIVVPAAPEIPVAEDPEDQLHFSGWQNVPQFMPNHDIYIDGILGYQITYTITLTTYNVTMTYPYSVQTYIEGTLVQAPAFTVPEGYTFSGWQNVPEVMPGKNLTVNATLTANPHTVTWKVNGEEFAVENYVYGQPIVVPEYTPEEGHTFIPWTGVPEVMPDEDLVFDTVCFANAHKITYIIHYVHGETEWDETYAVQGYDFGDEITVPEFEVPEGHQFTPWEGVPETMPDEDLEFVATLTADLHTVTFCDWNGVAIEVVENIPYGDAAEAPVPPVHTGYVSIGWDKDFSEVKEDMVVRAMYNALPETVTPAPDAVHFMVDSTRIMPDTEFTINFSLEGEFDAHTLTAYIYFEPEYLELVGFEHGEVWEQMIANDGVVACDIENADYTNANAHGKIGFGVVMPEDGFDMSGVIFSMTFRAAAELDDVHTPIMIVVDQFTNYPDGGIETPIPYYLTNGMVDIYDFMFGDVNGDGVVDAVDAILVMRHVLGIINIGELEDLPEGWTADDALRAADFNQDGFYSEGEYHEVITATDALLIMRYALDLTEPEPPVEP